MLISTLCTLLDLFDALVGLCLLINIDVNFSAVCLLGLFDALVGLYLLIKHRC